MLLSVCMGGQGLTLSWVLKQLDMYAWFWDVLNPVSCTHCGDCSQDGVLQPHSKQ